MSVIVEHLKFKTRGNGDMVDITPEVTGLLDSSGLGEGLVTVFAPGATAGVTTIEYEPGLVQDLQRAFEGVAPQDIPYAHNERWGDGNGHSHVRAALLGPSLVLPIAEGCPLLGTWQQVVLVDFDNRPRRRTWSITVLGE